MAWTDYWTKVASGSQGATGSAGSIAHEGDWVTGTAYHVGDIVLHTRTGYGDGAYMCSTAHTSGATTEPEVGGSWTDKWKYLAKGGQDGAGSGDLTKSGTYAADELLACVGTGTGLKSAGSKATVLSDAHTALSSSSTTPDGDVDTVIAKIAAGERKLTVDTLFTRHQPVSITASAIVGNGTAGCTQAAQYETSSNKINYMSCGFVHTSTSYGYASFVMPFGYTGGAIKAYIHWYSSGTTSNGVRWSVCAACVGDNETIDVSYGSEVAVSDTATGTAYRNLKTAVMSSITPGGTSPSGGELITIRVSRVPGHGDDTLNETAYLTNLVLLIPVNKQSEV